MSGVALRVTAVFVEKAAEQTLPQLMPTGALLIVPAPAPVLEMVRTGSVPIPFRETLKTGVSGSLEGISRFAVFAPVEAGGKAICTVREAAGARVWPEQVSPDRMNSVISVPDRDRLPIIRS